MPGIILELSAWGFPRVDPGLGTDGCNLGQGVPVTEPSGLLLGGKPVCILSDYNLGRGSG